ncbi:hypothetical protein [Brucella anthropi]|uniref:hypothetical protein n=1 Tax=Brucella anthropi TaxID=529 RepID=UPI00124E3211|nr:hypothetical protein [Brucella anthropi]KAB2752347.1 hypothetical protein F9L05_04335 [Brucella anthropi]
MKKLDLTSSTLRSIAAHELASVRFGRRVQKKSTRYRIVMRDFIDLCSRRMTEANAAGFGADVFAFLDIREAAKNALTK